MVEGGIGLAAHAAPARRAHAGPAAPQRPALGVAWPSGPALRRRLPGVRPLARPGYARGRGAAGAGGAGAPRRRLRRVPGGVLPDHPHMPPSPRPTPTSPPRCAACATARPTRWCSRWWTAPPFPTGRQPSSTRLPEVMAEARNREGAVRPGGARPGRGPGAAVGGRSAVRGRGGRRRRRRCPPAPTDRAAVGAGGMSRAGHRCSCGSQQ